MVWCSMLAQEEEGWLMTGECGMTETGLSSLPWPEGKTLNGNEDCW